jgi:hypothetical protein
MLSLRFSPITSWEGFPAPRLQLSCPRSGNFAPIGCRNDGHKLPDPVSKARVEHFEGTGHNFKP